MPKASTLRRRAAVLILAAVLAPVAWTCSTWADDWADLTSPTDDPDTTGPDLYSNKRFEDGVQSMPDLIAMLLAPPTESLPLPVESAEALALSTRSPILAEPRPTFCRGPPTLHSA